MYATVDTDRVAAELASIYRHAREGERNAHLLDLRGLAAMHNSTAAAIDGAARGVADAIRATVPDFDRGHFIRIVRGNDSPD